MILFGKMAIVVHFFEKKKRVFYMFLLFTLRINREDRDSKKREVTILISDIFSDFNHI